MAQAAAKRRAAVWSGVSGNNDVREQSDPARSAAPRGACPRDNYNK